MEEYLTSLERLRNRIIDSQIIAEEAKKRLEELMTTMKEDEVRNEAERLTQHND